MREISDLVVKGVVKLAPASSGYYSYMFLVQKVSGVWHFIFNLPTLNKFTLTSWLSSWSGRVTGWSW